MYDHPETEIIRSFHFLQAGNQDTFRCRGALISVPVRLLRECAAAALPGSFMAGCCLCDPRELFRSICVRQGCDDECKRMLQCLCSRCSSLHFTQIRRFLQSVSSVFGSSPLIVRYCLRVCGATCPGGFLTHRNTKDWPDRCGECKFRMIGAFIPKLAVQSFRCKQCNYSG